MHTISNCKKIKTLNPQNCKCILLQVGVKYGGEDIPGSPFPMSSNPSLDDVTSGSPNKMQNNQKGEISM